MGRSNHRLPIRDIVTFSAIGAFAVTILGWGVVVRTYGRGYFSWREFVVYTVIGLATAFFLISSWLALWEYQDLKRKGMR